jgi:hypothetical protein
MRVHSSDVLCDSTDYCRPLYSSVSVTRLGIKYIEFVFLTLLYIVAPKAMSISALLHLSLS